MIEKVGWAIGMNKTVQPQEYFVKKTFHSTHSQRISLATTFSKTKQLLGVLNDRQGKIA